MLIGVHELWLLQYGGYLDYSCLPHIGLVYFMNKGKHMGIWHNWAVYQRAQVIYGIAIVERKGLKEGVNGGKSDRRMDLPR